MKRRWSDEINRFLREIYLAMSWSDCRRNGWLCSRIKTLDIWIKITINYQLEKIGCKVYKNFNF